MLTKTGPYSYRAGVPSNDFEFIAAPQYAGRQRQTMWCWAASIQMVLNYHGLYVAQEQVVQRVFGLPYNSPANPNQILYALSGWAPDTRGRFSAIHAEYYPFTPFQLVTDLANNWPLLVGFRGNPIGHTCVLTAAEYLQVVSGFPILTKAIFRAHGQGILVNKNLHGHILSFEQPFLSEYGYLGCNELFAAQPGAAADVARRGEKLFKCLSLFECKMPQEEAGPRG